MVADAPPSSLDVSPGTLMMFAGDSREVSVKDQDGKGVQQGTWTVSDASVARVAELNGTTTVTALGAGTATLVVSKDGHTARASLTVYAADSTLPNGTTLWSLNDLSTWGAPKRGEVLRAASAIPDPDPTAAPALLFVDEGSEWGAGSLVRLYERPTRIRTTTPDGRELSNVTFAGRLPQQIAADNAGGFIVVLPALDAQPSMVQRFDGRTGLVSWEYIPAGGFLTDAAIHPDGTVYLSEFHITGKSYVVAVSAGGGVRKWPLPHGHFQQKDAGACGFTQEVDTPAHASAPIIREDGVVILLTHESFSSRPVYSYRDEQGACHTQGNISNSLAQTAHVVTVTGGELWAYPLNTAVSDIPAQTLEQKALLPDGHDGLLLVDRKVPWAMRISPGSGYPSAIDYRVTAANFAILPADGTNRYEAEYVLGEDGVYAVINSYRQSVGYAFYSKAIQFSADTLERISAVDLGIPKPEPQHIRLKFALAGGGVYLSGPTTAYVVNPTRDTAGFAAGGNAAPIVNEVWAGWDGSPRIGIGAVVATGATSWPWVNGTDGRSNESRPVLIGIFMKGHDVAYPLGRHATIRITPKDQALWLERRPDAFTQRDELGHYFATIGAGPGNNHQRINDTTTDCSTYLLTDAINFETDVSNPVGELELLKYAPSQENLLIEKLFKLEESYQDKLMYCFNPYYLNGPFYNSNSYVSGILRALSVPSPLKPLVFGSRYWGWAKPIPGTSFGTTDFK